MSDPRRRSVNEWYDNTLRSRLNSQEQGAIIIVMQRLHADDLVAHVQQTETWDVLSFPAVAEQDETYNIVTPYGRRKVQRKTGEILQPTLLSPTTLEIHRRAMTDYNFTAQYQQNPQPPSGIIVKRDWLKFYGPSDLPDNFDQVVQSWDTANKDSELANFSVCTTWGLRDQAPVSTRCPSPQTQLSRPQAFCSPTGGPSSRGGRSGRRQGVRNIADSGIARRRLFKGAGRAGHRRG